jgi:hypothetical protein
MTSFCVVSLEAPWSFLYGASEELGGFATSGNKSTSSLKVREMAEHKRLEF